MVGVLSSEGGSHAEILRADGTQVQRGGVCSGHTAGGGRSGAGFWEPLWAAVSGFASRVVGGLGAPAARGARTTHL